MSRTSWTMTKIEEVGALTIEQYQRHSYCSKDNGYWKCGCGAAISHAYFGSEYPEEMFVAHQNEAVGQFVERIVKEAVKLGGLEGVTNVNP